MQDAIILGGSNLNEGVAGSGVRAGALQARRGGMGKLFVDFAARAR